MLSATRRAGIGEPLRPAPRVCPGSVDPPAGVRLTACSRPPCDRKRAALFMLTIQQPALLECEMELAVLDELIAEVADGGRLLVVEGAPGIGKTRLLAEARRRARDSGIAVLSARGLELEHELAYGVVRQLFEPVVAALPDADRLELMAGPAASAAGVLDPARPIPEPGAGNPDTTFSTLHGLYWLAAGLAARGPLVLFVDDLHWCDLSSLRWLTYLLPRIEDLPLRMVAAGRPMAADPGASLRAHLTADPLAHLLRPGPLSEDACKALVEQVLQREPEDAFSEACHAESRGNPLWVREMARAVAAEGLPPTAANVHRLRELGREAVRRAVSLRLTRLPADAAAIARAVAILGDRTELGLAAALAERDEHDAYEAVRALAECDLLRSRPELSFVHPVVRAAVEAEISPTESDRAHRRAASLLAGDGSDPELVAMHVLKVRPAADGAVVDMLRAAAGAALARGATESSVAYLTRALREPPRPADRAGVLIELGLAESLVSGPAAAEHLGEALELVREPVQQAEIGLMLGRTLYFLSRPEEARLAFERALAELPAGDSPLRRVLEAAACHAGLSVGMPLAQVAHVAREHARATSPIPPTSADAGSRRLGVLARALGRGGRIGRRAGAVGGLRRRARRAGQRRRSAGGRRARGHARRSRRDRPARRVARESPRSRLAVRVRRCQGVPSAGPAAPGRARGGRVGRPRGARRVRGVEHRRRAAVRRSVPGRCPDGAGPARGGRRGGRARRCDRAAPAHPRALAAGGAGEAADPPR